MAETRLTRVAERLALVTIRTRVATPSAAGAGGAGSHPTLGWLPALPAANRVVVAAGREVLWLGPDEHLIVSAIDRGATLESTLKAGGAGAAVDLSANWVAFDLTGPRAREALAATCALDFHPRAFGTGQVAQTLIAKAPVIIWQRTDAPSFRILVRPSFARYLESWLDDAVGPLDE